MVSKDPTNKKVKQGQSSQRIVRRNGGKCKSTEVENDDGSDRKMTENDGGWTEDGRKLFGVGDGEMTRSERSGKFGKMVQWKN